MWAHSRDEVAYTHWAKGAATNHNDHNDCVQMTKDDDFKWSDTDCVFTKAAPICERDIEREKELEEDEEDTKKGEEKDHKEGESSDFNDYNSKYPKAKYSKSFFQRRREGKNNRDFFKTAKSIFYKKNLKIKTEIQIESKDLCALVSAPGKYFTNTKI